jgi:hypothetical protein
VVLFTTALGPYGGVLWSGVFQGFIVHELVVVPVRGLLLSPFFFLAFLLSEAEAEAEEHTVLYSL